MKSIMQLVPARQLKMAILLVHLLVTYMVTNVVGEVSTCTTASTLDHYSKAVVATDAEPCAEIGRSILVKGGHAVSAAAATQLCVGVYNAHSNGVGGGFVMTVYDKNTGNSVIDARETAPSAAEKDMYHGDKELASSGGLAVAIPGELMGYWTAYQKYETNKAAVTWKDLLQPTIDMCDNGHRVSAHLQHGLRAEQDRILNDPLLSEIFAVDGRLKKQGDRVVRTQLARTLEKVAEDINNLYGGELGKGLVEDINSNGGIITIDDLKNYKPVIRDPIQIDYSNNITLITAPPPASGAVLAFILNVMDLYDLSPESVNALIDSKMFHHRLVETFKHAYAARTKLADLDHGPKADMTNEVFANLTSKNYAKYIKSLIDDTQTFEASYYNPAGELLNDHGTAHVSVLDQNGNAVAVTSTINSYMGAVFMSKSTGIILNDEMDDFSSPNITNYFNLPPVESNYIEPGKKPMSSMSPSVFIDKNTGEAKLIVGSEGGSRITSTVALISLKNLWLGKDIKESIDDFRIHHQLFPQHVGYQDGFDKDILRHLQSLGHKVENDYELVATAATGIATDGQWITANSDFRKGGRTAGY